MKLWELYPEVRNLYEEYNGILLEDDFAWKELTEKAEQLITEFMGRGMKEVLVLYTVAEIERIARKRGESYEQERKTKLPL